MCCKYAMPGGGLPAEQHLRPRRSLGQAAARNPARHHRQETALLRDRCLRSGREDRHGRAHQHHHADLLLCHQRRPAARRRPSPRSRMPSRRPTASAAKPWCKRNFEAVDQTLANLHEVKVPDKVTSKLTRRQPCPGEAPEFVAKCLGAIIAGEGDNLPVSALPVDGTYPTGTTQWEKRNIALEIPVWEPDLCIQCGKCCVRLPACCHPREGVRPGLSGKALRRAGSRWMPRWKEFPGMKYTLVGGSRRLHRLRSVRGSLPGQG